MLKNKTNRQVVVSLVFLFLLMTACSNNRTTVTFVQPTQFPAAIVAEYFPLSKGAYWIYEGDVKWQIGSDIFEETMRWKMEVVEVVERNDIIGYKMLGALWDLEFYQDGRQPSEFAFIKVGTGRIYRGTIDQYSRMKDENDPLVDLVYDGDLFMDIPLTDGEKTCEAFSIARPDGFYCWRVKASETQLTDVVGVDTTIPMTEFVVSQSTNPDYSEFHFVPGIGITQFKYVHHGTISEVNISLVEYHSEQ